MSQEPLDHPDQVYKVVVWATGRVGRLAIRAVADRPNLELVGVWVHSESKDGKDAGTIAGIDPLGVAATRDDTAILAGDADCIIYTGPATSRPREAITDFCRILESGKNIVTTSVPGLVYPRGSIKQSTVHRRLGDNGWQLDLFIGHRTRVRLRSAGRCDGVDVESDLLDSRLGDHRLLA
jgi:hypothetical protein